MIDEPARGGIACGGRHAIRCSPGISAARRRALANSVVGLFVAATQDWWHG